MLGAVLGLLGGGGGGGSSATSGASLAGSTNQGGGGNYGGRNYGPGSIVQLTNEPAMSLNSYGGIIVALSAIVLVILAVLFFRKKK